MSQEEQKALIGEILIRYQERKKTLCCMETKARVMAEKLEAMAKILQSVPGFIAPPRHNSNLVPEFPGHGEVFELVCEITDLRGEIATNRKSLAGMGVQFPVE